MRPAVMWFLRAYQVGISPFTWSSCRFYPTCSNYSYQAIEKYGVIKGGWLTAKRLSRCHPWHPGGVDEVP